MKPAWALDVASKGGAIARISRADTASVENGSMSCNSLHDGKPYSAHIESPDSRLRPPQYCTGSPETMAGFAPDPRRSFGLDGLSFGAGNVSSANSFPWPDLRWTAYPKAWVRMYVPSMRPFTTFWNHWNPRHGVRTTSAERCPWRSIAGHAFPSLGVVPTLLDVTALYCTLQYIDITKTE